MISIEDERAWEVKNCGICNFCDFLTKFVKFGICEVVNLLRGI